LQRNIELLIGRLVTDEEFRRSFQQNPREALRVCEHCGLALSAVEITALLATDHTLWDRISRELDGRLQKASLKVAIP
jgi:putative modified peptide